MQVEWAAHQEGKAAPAHRQRALEGLRAALDAFNPDFLLIWGDARISTATAATSRTRPALARALLRTRRHHRTGAARLALAGGGDRLLELVACVPDRQAPLPVSGSGLRPSAFRGAARRPDVSEPVSRDRRVTLPGAETAVHARVMRGEAGAVALCFRQDARTLAILDRVLAAVQRAGATARAV
jgi:hypothetical protein